MTRQLKNIQMLVSMLVDGKSYHAHRTYSVPAPLAAELVREKTARFLRPTAPTAANAEEGWQATVRDGDTFAWQITLDLPNLVKPRISAKYETAPAPARTRSRKRHLKEIGGDGPRVTPPQAKAIEYLARNETNLYPKLLAALSAYANRCRTAWKFDDRLAPRNMTPTQVSHRVEFRKIYVSRRARDGVAYLEFHGECAWDREHGFSIVTHRQRIVAVTQQGTGWTDRHARRRRPE